MMWWHLLSLSRAEFRHHPWRHGVAMLAVALGVALASSVQLINASALSEFAQAVRSANGQPDVVIAATGREGFDDALFGRLSMDGQVALISPVVETDSYARAAGTDATTTQATTPAAEPAATSSATTPAASVSRSPATLIGLSNRVPVRILGIDPLKVAAVAPALLPRPANPNLRSGLLDPDAAYLNAAARERLQLADGQTILLQGAGLWHSLRVAGSITAGGGPLVVVDIAAAQAAFGYTGKLSRLDIKLASGVDAGAWQQAQTPGLPAHTRWAAADDAVQRVSNLSRAYRVNLGVLALVALLVGGFLVYSVVSLSVAQRTPSFALLGVLGLAAADRRRLVLAESALLGAAGSAVGLALGCGLAWAALRLLGGDLGGGYFAGGAPALAWAPWTLALCALLGTAAAVVGAWWPARQAEKLSPAMALKGLGSAQAGDALRWVHVWPGLALLAGGSGLALLPPIAGLPLAAYAAVALLLGGGVVLVPALVQTLLAWLPLPEGAVALLALRRARYARQTASATVAGVVASLALSVALTVMVASFRDAVITWLDSVLPADLYARTAGSSAASDQAFLPPGLASAAAGLPGVARVQASRQMPLQLLPRQPAVVLMTRDLADPARALPLLGEARPMPAAETGNKPGGPVGVYVSEPAAAIYHLSPGDSLRLPLPGGDVDTRVLGIWRDYARQFGAIAMDAADYRRLTGDKRVNDIALWLQPGTPVAGVEQALHALAGPDLPLDLASTAELRRVSLAIFDRSFAVTTYLQAVAIAVGLVGVAASLSAQVLARRKEFGLLAHLGLAHRQVVALVAAETAAWLAAGTLMGLALGLAIAVVLVQVVNPQSFHWTMPLQLPGGRLALLAGAVMVAGLATALLAARSAANQQAVLAVKEDW